MRGPQRVSMSTFFIQEFVLWAEALLSGKEAGQSSQAHNSARTELGPHQASQLSGLHMWWKMRHLRCLKSFTCGLLFLGEQEYCTALSVLFPVGSWGRSAGSGVGTWGRTPDAWSAYCFCHFLAFLFPNLLLHLRNNGFIEVIHIPYFHPFKLSDAIVFSIFADMCNHHHTQL